MEMPKKTVKLCFVPTGNKLKWVPNEDCRMWVCAHDEWMGNVQRKLFRIKSRHMNKETINFFVVLFRQVIYLAVYRCSYYCYQVFFTHFHICNNDVPVRLSPNFKLIESLFSEHMFEIRRSLSFRMSEISSRGFCHLFLKLKCIWEVDLHKTIVMNWPIIVDTHK